MKIDRVYSVICIKKKNKNKNKTENLHTNPNAFIFQTLALVQLSFSWVHSKCFQNEKSMNLLRSFKVLSGVKIYESVNIIYSAFRRNKCLAEIIQSPFRRKKSVDIYIFVPNYFHVLSQQYHGYTCTPNRTPLRRLRRYFRVH